MIKFIMPLAIYLPRKTKKDRRVAISLNVYRNLHHQINNQVKKEYKKIVQQQIDEMDIVSI
jgi:hypothetical protein